MQHSTYTRNTTMYQDRHPLLPLPLQNSILPSILCWFHNPSSAYLMEFVGSNAPPATAGYNPSQHVADRIIRAFRQRLRLLHRSDASFYVLGATGNVYTVTLSAAPSCTCPDRTVPCKHILFVLLRVLGLPLDDNCLWRRTLRPRQLARLLSIPSSPDAFAGTRARERFHQVFSGATIGRPSRPSEDGAVCPICLEEMGGTGGVACGRCGNSLHEECLVRWKRSRGRRAATCVVCRARWRESREQERYVNLAAYVDEENDAMEAGGSLCAG